MRFLMTFLTNRSELPDPALSDKCFGEMMSFVDELKAVGQLVFDSQVLPEPAAVRVWADETATQVDEPDSEFVLAGFFVIDAPSHADALAIVRRCPHARVGAS